MSVPSIILKFLPLVQGVATTPADSVSVKHADMELLKSLPTEELISKFVSGLVSLAINILIASIVFYVGKFLIKKVYMLVNRLMLRRNVDNSLMTFVLSFVRIVLYFILIVTVVGILGIETSSFIALFASAGVALGMALSGTLQNFAGGVLILLLKPYRVGDYIEAQGFAGTVKEIQIFHTIILTPDNKSIIIPNGGLSTGSVNNFSRENYRRVDWTVGISYGDDIDVARKAILDIIAADARIVKQYVEEFSAIDEPASESNDSQADTDASQSDDAAADADAKGHLSGLLHRHRRRVEQWHEKHEAAIKEYAAKVDCSPAVVVESLDDSAVTLKVRAWTRTSDYWGVYYSINEAIYKQLPAAGVSFPFPQLDVHISDNN